MSSIPIYQLGLPRDRKRPIKIVNYSKENNVNVLLPPNLNTFYVIYIIFKYLYYFLCK